MTDEEDTQPTRPARIRRVVTNAVEEEEAPVPARCSEVGVTGVCDAPADLRCPSCGCALCYACAREHTKRDAPTCNRAGTSGR